MAMMPCARDRAATAWIAVLVALLVSATGCVRVHAWQRGRLASWAMTDPFGSSELEAQYRSKLVESKTGGGLPGTAPGGGCGCSQ